ncbi:MAG: hypothetical protein KUG82_19470 [Pseudomonadales bacterium]|nr:hypothetical protein [Pseudomonadales bacterium]
MKHSLIQLTPLLTLLILFLSTPLYADGKSDTASSQKAAIGHMHHKLHDDQTQFKAKEALALKQLNEMTILENVKMKDVDAKIDELMAAKKAIMHLRYKHLIEMRTILTDDQKIGYDKGVLKRSAIR